MSLNVPTRAAGGIPLVAETDSVLGEWVASHLEKHDFQVDRATLGAPIVGERAAAVIVIERETAIDTLRATLDQSTTPTLVLVATRELVVRVLPLLEAWHDLAPASETADVVAWRLQRLIDLARRSALGLRALDPLTGVLSRSTFEKQLRHVVGSLSPGEVSGVINLDLDRFKLINDRLGHDAGDRMLKSIGKLLERRLAPGDLVSRLGGDEFACLLRRRDADSVRRDAALLLAAISNFGEMAALADPSLPPLTASAGLTFLQPDADVDRLLSEADEAMYRAKSSGRSRLEIFGSAADPAGKPGQGSGLQHFENVTRVATERLIGMITLNSRRLLDAANEKANFCALTGLGNRGFFDSQLAREMAVARVQGHALSMAFVDLDQFGAINKTYGWPTGDRVLQAFARVAHATVRSTDWTIRYGGEEFAVVMPGTTLDQAVEVAERLRQAFANSRIEAVDGRTVSATLSAGVAQLPAGTESAVALVELASNALKLAKSSGRNRVEQFHPAGIDIATVPGAAEPTSRRTDDPFDLARFVAAQADVYQRFVGELRRGRKLTHCMWFMFPQLQGLGYSHESRVYGISGLTEAVAYLAHPVLGVRLRECAESLEALDPRLPVEDIFRYPDDLKLRSSLTLFALAAAPGSVFERLIGRYFMGVRDHITVARLQRRGAVEIASAT